MNLFSHCFPFDPSYGHTLESLLQVLPPAEPSSFQDFWQSRYQKALQVNPALESSQDLHAHPDFEVKDVFYQSTDNFRIGGWLLTPKAERTQRGLIVSHGYGGRDGPDFDLVTSGTAVFFPCCRGLSRSARQGISSNPAYHVLHDIDKPGRYIMGGCVEDIWVGVTAMLRLFPQIEGRIGFQGTSFGGGIGAMAVAWDPRIRRAAFNVPTFGHQTLRLGLPTTGSGAAVSLYQKRHGNVIETLQFYDAALSARHIPVPVHVAAALFDPVVAPPGQFALYNALPGPRELFVAQAGHFDFPGRAEQDLRLLVDLQRFFDPL
jgi:cephalosporin-C deacetylase